MYERLHLIFTALKVAKNVFFAGLSDLTGIKVELFYGFSLVDKDSGLQQNAVPNHFYKMSCC